MYLFLSLPFISFQADRHRRKGRGVQQVPHSSDKPFGKTLPGHINQFNSRPNGAC